ncbi:hypothetical protein HK097_007948 [Rhizophlyctis rosea]|uniref:Thioesterase domain-containing protein n=1 Tax=Rhizophlyctis rosea TaxID=64517 RepID=A0AAD5SE20_9FUNG|nr:hypothetical protein HK097_007948 [Rhizophlyctis rosea]
MLLRTLRTLSTRHHIRTLPLQNPTASVSTSQAPAPSSRLRTRFLLGLALGATLPSLYAYQLKQDSAPLPLTSDSEEAAHTALLEAERDDHELVKKLRGNSELNEVEDVYAYLDGKRLWRNFTGGVLRGKGKFALKPALFHNKDQTEIIAIIHVGERMCGHDGIVHGGVLSTLMDEMLARCTIPSLPNHIGFTANLNINFRKPVRANQFLILHSRLKRLDGRKAYGEAWIEGIDGQGVKYVEAEALFVSPKNPLVGLLRWRPS